MTIIFDGTSGTLSGAALANTQITGVVTNNINTSSLVTGGVSLGAGNASIMKNRIINGCMNIAQYGTGSTSVQTTTTYASCDRWATYASVNSKFTVQQNAGAITPPVGFSNYLGCTSSAATTLSATDFYVIQQRIEGYNFVDIGYGTANAKTTTLSAWVYSSLTGTFGGSYGNNTQGYPFTYSIPVANTWTQISITVPGCTNGSWSSTNGVGLILCFSLGTGTTYSGTAGAWGNSQAFSATGATSVVGTNGATFYITGVQLEVGSSATGFEYRQYGQELSLCQRYYFNQDVSSNDLYGGLYNASLSRAIINVPYHVTMRTNPSCTATYGGDISANAFFGTKDICYVYCNTVGSAGYLTSFTASAEL